MYSKVVEWSYPSNVPSFALTHLAHFLLGTDHCGRPIQENDIIYGILLMKCFRHFPVCPTLLFMRGNQCRASAFSTPALGHLLISTMTATQSTTTFWGRTWPTFISSIVDNLPPIFTRESSSTATCTGSTEYHRDKKSKEHSGRRIVIVQESKHCSGPTASETNICHDTTSHTQLKGRIELSRRVRSMLRKALPDKESVYTIAEPQRRTDDTRNCVACDKQVRKTKLITAPCGHIYCPRCLYKIAVLSLQDHTRFPVRCCSQEIPVARVACVMNAKGRQLYMSRTDEHAEPPAERWYCPNTTCGRWIPLRHIKTDFKTQKCPHCRAIICTICHDLAHENSECTQDPGLDQLLEMARRQHWQRCYNCHALVWKTGGCNHMRCKCGAHFWYAVFNFKPMVWPSANENSYICGRQYPRCGCRSSIALNNGGQIGDGDLDVATVVAAMEIAERDEAQVMYHEPWMILMPPDEGHLQQWAQQSRPPQAQSLTRARVIPPARTVRPLVPIPATPLGPTRRQATPRPARHRRQIPGVLPNEAGRAQRNVWLSRRVSVLNQLNRAALERPRRPGRPGRPTLSGMPVMPVRSAI